MSIFATIYNTEFEPLTARSEVETDAEFSGIEAKAQELAAGGTKCCIWLRRDSDGQVAYWGPAGATLKAHWYAKPGRPEEMQGGKPRNVYLDNASWSKALDLGNGNASDGIRAALASAGRAMIAKREASETKTNSWGSNYEREELDMERREV